MTGTEFLIQLHAWPRFRRGVSLAVAVAWFLVWLIPGNALAQSEADRATARNLAAEGNTALKTQDFATAEDRFRRADALVHAPTLVVDHARALIGLGRFVEAEERLELVIREGVADNAPWVWKKAIQEAEKLVTETKPKVAWLTINISGPNEPRVTVDGKLVPVAALGVRRAVDPGDRHIVAEANGYVPTEISVTMPQGGERAVSLDLKVDPEARVVPPPMLDKPKEPAPQSAPLSKTSDNTLAYVALGLGGAGLVAGTVTGILWFGKKSDINTQFHCVNSICPPDAQSDITANNRVGIISGISFGVGIASGAIGTWLLLTSSTHEPGKGKAGASVLPYASLGDVGLVGAF